MQIVKVLLDLFILVQDKIPPKKIHEGCSFACNIVRSDGKLPHKRLYRGENAMDQGFKSLEKDLVDIRKDLKNIRKLIMTSKDWEHHENADTCWICNKPFVPFKKGDKGGLWKVKDHDHLTGIYRGHAHSKCNQQLRIKPYETPIPVFFHNLKNYDAHLLMSAVGNTIEKKTTCTDKDGKPITFKDKDGNERTKTVIDGKLSVIAQNMEKLISFSWGQFRFVDSFAFLSSSLSNLVKNNIGATIVCQKCKKEKGSSIDEDWVYDSRCQCGVTRAKQLDKSALPSLLDQNHSHLLARNGEYPYEYMDDFSKFEETTLPAKDKFYSRLSDENISDENYKHAQDVCEAFDCKNLGDYHDSYLKTDVNLLTDVFENFRRKAMNTYELDSANYYTLPGYNWDVLLNIQI